MMTTELEVPETGLITETPQEEPAKEQGEVYDPRKTAMESILANRQKVVDAENATAREMAGQHEENAPLEEAVIDEPVVTPQPIVEQPLTPSKVKLTAYGREIEASPEEMVTLAQKGLAADQKWQEAARMRDEAAQIYGQVQQRQQPAPVQTQPTHIIDDASAREIQKKLNYGSEDEQIQAIRDIGDRVAQQFQGRQTNMPTPEQLVQAASNAALAQMRFESNLDTIAKEYADVFNDKALAIAAAVVLDEIRSDYAVKGIQKSDLDLYREASQTTRDRYVKAPVTSAASTPEKANSVQAATSNDKLERKRAAPQPPSAVSKTMTIPVQKAPTGSDIVAQMRKSRGQVN